MAANIKSLEEFITPKEYTLERSEYVEELGGFAMCFRHNLSQARVLAISCNDDNKVFSIGFRTPPKTSTGVPHIIEHTVLCGSKKYPAKDPFVELVKGSLNTFLNATTYPDKTLYPIASRNDKDFSNLMSVYMDAVFYPNIYKHEEIFRQEGWHFELEDEDAELTYNGVVYNEMKGVYASEDNVLENYIMQALFPDVTYGCDSGGDPDVIPELSYEEYLNFHKKYYHPSNSYIYLYGDMDVAEKLKWMDSEYLKDFSVDNMNEKTDSVIKLQKPFESMKVVKKKYAVSEDADITEKYFYAFGVVMDITLDVNISRAFDVLSYVLAEQPGAPLKKAILDAGIGNDVDADFTDIIRQSTFSISTKNAKKGLREEFHKVIINTLRKLVKDGINKRDLEAAVNGMEFREREADYGTYPKGLLYGMKTMKTWLYDDNMQFDALKYNECFEFLRSKLDTDYYENLIKTYILDNPHCVLLEMQPEKGLNALREKNLAQKLATYKASLTKEEIKKLVEETKALKKYQEEPSPKEILEKIPMLSRDDIGREIQPVYNDVKEFDSVKVIHHNTETNDIAYIDLLFNVDDLQDYMPQLSFTSTLLGYMDTGKYDYREFDTEVNFHTGGIMANPIMFVKNGKPDEYQVYMEIRLRVLRRKLKEAFDLAAEMVFNTVFDDEKHLYEVVGETVSRTKMKLINAGHVTATSRALSSVSKTAWLNDASVGVRYYDYIKGIFENFDDVKDTLKLDIKKLLAHFLKKDRLMVSITGDEKVYAAFEKEMTGFLSKLDAYEKSADVISLSGQELDSDRYVPVLKDMNEGISIPGEIQFVAMCGKFDVTPETNFGAIRVVRQLLNYDYLWNNVRVLGGAYGVSCNFNNEGEAVFASYRDPGLENTLETYKGTEKYLREYDADEREVTKTVIGTISGLDTPLTPIMKGRRSLGIYMSDRKIEDLKKEREQILNCTADDIRNISKVIKQIMSKTDICAVGNEQKINKDAGLFGNIRGLE